MNRTDDPAAPDERSTMLSMLALHRVVLGENIDDPWTDKDPDGEMIQALDMTVDQVIMAYESQVLDSDAVIERLDLEQLTAVRLSDFHPNVRWVLLHLVEETARHNGQLDLLRELADGSVGH